MNAEIYDLNEELNGTEGWGGDISIEVDIEPDTDKEAILLMAHGALDNYFEFEDEEHKKYWRDEFGDALEALFKDCNPLTDFMLDECLVLLPYPRVSTLCIGFSS